MLEFSVAGFAHKNNADFDFLVAAFHRLLKIPLGPGGDHIGHIDRIALLAQQMIGTGERYETLGMLGGSENTRSILDADDVVGGRMKHQQRLAKIGETILDILLGNVIEEFTLDAKWPTGQRHLDLALSADFIDVFLEQVGHVCRIAGRGHGDHSTRVGDAMCSSKRRGTS